MRRVRLLPRLTAALVALCCVSALAAGCSADARARMTAPGSSPATST